MKPSLVAVPLVALCALALATERRPGPPQPVHVEPGLVAWHPDLEAACEAARESGKPVLLFQLLGRLDEELC